jgi:hypothetical protein
MLNGIVKIIEKSIQAPVSFYSNIAMGRDT